MDLKKIGMNLIWGVLGVFVYNQIAKRVSFLPSLG
jgi:hypothetical protein